MSNLNLKVIEFVKGKRGHKVGAGECWDLAEEALKAAGAKTSRDYGVITANANYKWGNEIGKNELKAGDIAQFRNYKIEVITKTHVRIDKKYADGSTEWSENEDTNTQTNSFPHHTAVVGSALNTADNTVSLYHQNVENVKLVKTGTLILKDSETVTTNKETLPNGTKTTTTTVTIKVSGKIWFYRPQAK